MKVQIFKSYGLNNNIYMYIGIYLILLTYQTGFSI